MKDSSMPSPNTAEKAPIKFMLNTRREILFGKELDQLVLKALNYLEELDNCFLRQLAD